MERNIWNNIPRNEFDLRSFEEHFSLKEIESSPVKKKAESKFKSPRLHLIEHKRSRQYAIMLGRFPSLEVLKESIEKCDFNVLDAQKIKMMNEMVSLLFFYVY
jgi:hypothetical protein